MRRIFCFVFCTIWCLAFWGGADAAINPFNVPSLASIAALQAVQNPISGQTYSVGGTQGGGSLFTWVTGSLPCTGANPPATAGGDSGTTFCTSNGSGGSLTSGYWKRQFATSDIPAEWFGAVLGAESGAAINAALTYTATNGGCVTLQGAGQDYLSNQTIEFGGNSVVNCLKGTGPGQAGIMANANSLNPLIRIDGEFDRIENIAAIGNSKTGGSGFGFVPQNESQTTTLTNTDHVYASNLFSTGFAIDAFRWRTGPNVTGSDSASYRSSYIHLQAANSTNCFHFTASANGGGGSNDNDFYALSCENTGTAPSEGILFDASANTQGNRFYGITGEGITAGHGYGIEVNASNTHNKFIGIRFETVTADIYNNATANQFISYAPSGAGNIWTTKPAILTGETGIYNTVQNRYTNFGAIGTFSTAANAAYRMGGYGSSWKITPAVTGNVRIRVMANCQESATGGVVVYDMTYGTGTAPIQGAVSAGTVLTTGNFQVAATIGSNVSQTGLWAACPYEAEVSGLTIGTAYWFDWEMYSLTTGTATLQPVSVIIEEF